MGWSYTFKPSSMSVADFFKKEFKGEFGKVIGCAVKGMRTAYLAYEITKDGERKVFAFVCLLNYSKDHYNFGYKDMDESMGPYYYDCPKRILDLLTPTDNVNALEWRKECLKRLSEKDSLNSQRKVFETIMKPGLKLFMKPSVSIPFAIFHEKRGKSFLASYNFMTYKVSAKHIDFEKTMKENA